MNKNVLFLGAPVPPALAGGAAGIRLTSVFNQGLDYLGTINGRVGYAWNTVLVYGTGGLAFGKVRYGASVYFPGLGLVGNGSDGGIETGFNYGGGIEVALPKDGFLDKFDVLKLVGIEFGGTSTLKAEYIRYDLGSKNVQTPSFVFPGTSGTARFHSEGSIIRAGFSYKFP